MRREEFRYEKATQLKKSSACYENVFRGLRKGVNFIFCFILVSADKGRVCQGFLNSSTRAICGL